MKKFIPLGLLSVLLILTSCTENYDHETVEYTISGSVQKGPFINGSDITIYELDHRYKQTGKSFLSTAGNEGEFEVTGLELISSFAEMMAEGFYFNEISGELSSAQINLRAITELNSSSPVNINLLTHLEYERVKYLLKEEGMDLREAKTQAQQEILAVFSLDEITTGNSESLNIISSGEGDAILLAISAIMQGNHTTPELSLLMANVITDMKTDGVLDDTLIQSDLMGQALTLNCDQIRQNIVEYYGELGSTLDVLNHFEDYINHFITHAGYSHSSPFNFPVSTDNGLNVLYPEHTEFQLLTLYGFAVDMPGAGQIIIKMRITKGDGGWWYAPFEVYGWQVSNFNFATNEQVFTSMLNDVTIDLPIVEFSGSGEAVVEYYYNGAQEPSFTKSINWGAENNTDFIFPNDSPGGLNLLNTADQAELPTDTTYTVGLRKPGSWDVNFVLAYSAGVNLEVPGGWGEYTYTDAGSAIEFKLSGKNEGDYISEIQVRCSGTGTVQLTSSDLEISEGEYLDRSYTLY